MAYIDVILLSLGLLALFVELFIPGFGIFGAAGLILLAASAVLTIIYIPYGTFIVIGELIVIFVIGYLLFDHAKKNGIYGKLILKETLKENADDTEVLSTFINKEGVSKTPLKPCGNVIIDGVTLEAYSDGDFILPNEKIIGVKVAENKLYVKKIK